MKYVLIIVSCFLGFVGFLFDGILFPRGDVLLLTFILFTIPGVYCVGDMWDHIMRQELEDDQGD